MAQELKVIQDFYDFMLWLIQHTEKFPRHHRLVAWFAERSVATTLSPYSNCSIIEVRWGCQESIARVGTTTGTTCLSRKFGEASRGC